MHLLIRENLIGRMNNIFLIISFISFVYCQHDISTKQYSFYKSDEVNSIDFSKYINDIDGKYIAKIISIENADFKKNKRTLIDNCDLKFSISNDISDIEIKRCNNIYNYNGNLLIDKSNNLVTINTDRYNYLNCTIVFWITGFFLNDENSLGDISQNGILNEYYDDGSLYIKYNFKSGKKDGIQKRWHKNGQLEIIYNYKNGKLEGLQKKWYNTGLLKGEWNYSDDKLHGTVKEWYPNSQIKFIKNYDMGTLIKVIEHYEPDGSIIQ